MTIKPEGWERPDSCEVPGCEQGGYVFFPGYCSMHWQRNQRTGSPGLAQPQRRLKGQGHKNSEGYIQVWAPDHPNASGNRTIPEHRLVMSNYLGRPLTGLETVHHINGQRDDNRIENLELWSSAQPAGQRVSDKLAWAKQFISEYEAEPAKRALTEPLCHLAVDFDGTLAVSLWTSSNRTTDVGDPLYRNIVKLKEAVANGSTWDLHTARGWEDRDTLELWLKGHELYPRMIVCGKPLASSYIDDRAQHESAPSWIPGSGHCASCTCRGTVFT